MESTIAPCLTFSFHFFGTRGASLDKKGGNTVDSDRSNMSSNTVNERVFADPEQARDHANSEQLDHLDTFNPSSASEKAEQLPHKMWVIIVAGLLAWTIVAIVAFLFFV